MQKFILLILALGLAFFLYLLQSGQISNATFNVKSLQGETEFEIRKSTGDMPRGSSDIFAIIRDKDYKVFTFSGNDFNKLLKAEYSLEKYRVPFDAIDAISGTWIGNRYVFYILLKVEKDTGKKIYEIYKTEYPTDELGKLKFFLIKAIPETEVDNTFEVRY
ncbi:hypothetical protein H7X65_02655 [Candidatus Parcubacteria bacterium]|nr:hypothetical protein [Candidatus Parcubacteria bacterium]